MIFNYGKEYIYYHDGNMGLYKSKSKKGIIKARRELIKESSNGKSGMGNYRLKPFSMFLSITGKCNMKCPFCYQKWDGNDNNGKKMNEEVINRSINMLFDSCDKKRKQLIVNIIGGEPFLELDTIKYIIETGNRISKKKGVEIVYNITTNGSILNEAILNIIKNHNIYVLVSFEGLREYQDQNRIFQSNKKSYDTVYKNCIKLLREIGPRIMARGTISSEKQSMYKMVLSLYNAGFRRFDIDIGLSKKNRLNDNMIKELCNDYNKIVKDIKARILNDGYYFNNIMSLIQNLYYGVPRSTKCSAGTGTLAIGADGSIFPCQNMEGLKAWRMGDVFNGINNCIIDEWSNTAYVGNHNKCKKCWANKLCGGPCRSHSILFNNNNEKPYEMDCRLIKNKIRYVIDLMNKLTEEELVRIIKISDINYADKHLKWRTD